MQEHWEIPRSSSFDNMGGNINNLCRSGDFASTFGKHLSVAGSLYQCGGGLSGSGSSRGIRVRVRVTFLEKT